MGCKFFVGDKVFDKEGLKAYLLENNFEQLTDMVKNKDNVIRKQIMNVFSDNNSLSENKTFIEHEGFNMNNKEYSEIENIAFDVFSDNSLNRDEQFDKFFQAVTDTEWFNNLSDVQRKDIRALHVVDMLHKGVQFYNNKSKNVGSVANNVTNNISDVSEEDEVYKVSNDKPQVNNSDKKIGEKSVQKRINQDYNDDDLREIAIKSGLYYEVENQKEEFDNAKKIVHNQGIEVALDMLDNTTVNHELSHF